MLLENLNSFRGGGRPIADFLAWRLHGFPSETDAFDILIGNAEGGPFALIGLILSDINWPHMALGLIFTAPIIKIASTGSTLKPDKTVIVNAVLRSPFPFLVFFRISNRF